MAMDIINLPQSQLMAFNEGMKRMALAPTLNLLLNAAEADDNIASWRQVFLLVFGATTAALESTDLYPEMIKSTNNLQLLDIIESFSDDEVSEWKQLVRKGLKHGDWNGVVMHRTHHLVIDHPVVLKF
jgi:hypothetical protein